jgi:hypothetical protein
LQAYVCLTSSLKKSVTAAMNSSNFSRRILCPAPMIRTQRNGFLLFHSLLAFSATSVVTMPFSAHMRRVGQSIRGDDLGIGALAASHSGKHG